jgi:hypothetical protein
MAVFLAGLLVGCCLMIALAAARATAARNRPAMPDLTPPAAMEITTTVPYFTSHELRPQADGSYRWEPIKRPEPAVRVTHPDAETDLGVHPNQVNVWEACGWRVVDPDA